MNKTSDEEDITQLATEAFLAFKKSELLYDYEYTLDEFLRYYDEFPKEITLQLAKKIVFMIEDGCNLFEVIEFILFFGNVIGTDLTKKGIKSKSK